ARGRAGSAQRLLAAVDEGLPAALRTWAGFFNEEDREAIAPGGDDWGRRDYQAIWDRSEGAPLVDRLLHLNLRTYLLDDLLPKVDRMSMAHGLEVRSPFLDARLVELAMRIPGEHKLRGFALKRVLKAAVADLLPAELLNRRKRGFGVPVDRWLRTDLKAYIEDMLGSPSARVRAHLDGDAVDRLLAEHAGGERPRGHQLWALLTLEVFLRREGW
ncbi:MAG: asnB, partial [Solirubrobacterales bacterium]|nr:asnB [Solirubrobacterales bacterium]